MSDFSTIEEIIQDARDGKMYILVDSEDRENEGDIIIPASTCKPDHINFMATHGRGLICLSISETRASELKLPLMNPDNWKKKLLHSPFQLSLVKILLQEFQLLIGLKLLELLSTLILNLEI